MNNLERYSSVIRACSEITDDDIISITISLMEELGVGIEDCSPIQQKMIAIEWLLAEYKPKQELLTSADKKFLHNFLEIYDYPDFNLKKYKKGGGIFLDITLILEKHKDENGKLIAEGVTNVTMPISYMKPELFTNLKMGVEYLSDDLVDVEE